MEISPTQVEEVLSAAKNLNAALKTFLKREARSENAVEAFVKSLRNVVARDRDGELLSYIEKHYENNEVHFAILAAYAFPELQDSVISAVYDQYGEDFNATYERRDKVIHITNPARFSSISRQVVTKIEEGLDQAGIPRNNFSVYSLLATIFEPDVLVQVLETLK